MGLRNRLDTSFVVLNKCTRPLPEWFAAYCSVQCVVLQSSGHVA